jgi:hypothetical protein
MPFTHGHALVIGVGTYQHMSQYNVPIGAVDAQAVADTLQDPARCGYPAGQITLLQNESATRAAVLNALNELADKLDTESTLFLFFVGHGVYGTDGNYYLTTHDSQLQGKQLKAGTGVSEAELIDKLRQVKAKRMLLVINACHSGELSPSFDIGDEALNSEPPPQKLSDALLSTGEGRITITACRPQQKSWIGLGKLSIFTQALVGGLNGAAPNNKGYISAFGLYEHVYFSAKEAAEDLGQTQEAELTVLKGVGPFPVALYNGASKAGSFDASEPAPGQTAVRQVSPETSRRVYERYVSINVGGDVKGNIVIGDNNRISD